MPQENRKDLSLQIMVFDLGNKFFKFTLLYILYMICESDLNYNCKSQKLLTSKPFYSFLYNFSINTCKFYSDLMQIKICKN